jgi:hypothetical protein
VNWLWLVFACAGDAVLPALAPPEAAVEVRAQSAKVDAGEPVLVDVSAWSGEGWVVQPGAPQAEGLTVELVTAGDPVQSGDRVVRTWTYALSGEPGSYIVSTSEGHATGPGDQERTFEPQPIFVDIGVPGPTGGPMDGFADPPPPPAPPWRWIALVGALGLAFAALAVALILWWRRPRAKHEPPPLPADIAALQAWEAARGAREAGEIDDHGLALALSQILRSYLEAVFGWPVTKRTTREILDMLDGHSAGSRSLGVADRMRTTRILDATDRLKFAREGGGEPFFGALEQDFTAVIVATRPGATVEAARA